MSIVVPPVVNKTSVKPFRTVCYDNNLVTSRGVFLGDDPLSFSLPLLLLELPLIFLTSHAIHLLLTPLRQPRVVTQILTGVLFGPSVIGRSFVFQETVFPPRGTFILDTISMLSLNLFLFSIGVKTDLSLLKKPGWRAVTIGIVGSLLPFFLCLVIFAALRGSVPAELAHGTLIMTIAGRLSLSSFAVISHALEEQGLLNSELGRVALTASLITDVCNWAVSSVETAAKLAVKAGSPEMAVASVAALAAFSLFVVFVARPVALWTVRRTPAGQLMDEGHFVAMIVAALLAAFTTEVLGYHAAFGPAMLGLAFPGGMPMGVTLTERLDSFLSGLFLPLYLVLAGYRTDFTDLGSWPTWGTLELVVILCFVGKLVGTIAAALYFKMPFKDALIVGLMVNIKGIIEVSFLNNSGDSEMATAQHFSVLMVSILAITAVTTPLIKFLYDPSARYVAGKRRSVEHMKPDSDFRILAAVQSESEVPVILDLLESLHPYPHSPLNIFVLHLTELSGRAASVLRPHRLSPRHPSNFSHSDRIVNAFRYFKEQHTLGSLQLHPFVAVSPTATMHNDVCSLALRWKARLVVLPFCRRQPELVRNVLDYAPCSVAVLVVVGDTSTSCARPDIVTKRAAVVFLGGADDREALAIGGRMAGGGVGVTVLRVRGRGEPAAVEDEEAVARFRRVWGEREGVEYVERVVGDGEGTVGMVRGAGEMFDLVVVGRRKGMAGEEATKGIEAWSQWPELGVVGDMLASTEVGGRVAILIVQQQEWKGKGTGKEDDGSGEGGGGAAVGATRDVLMRRMGD